MKLYPGNLCSRISKGMAMWWFDKGKPKEIWDEDIQWPIGDIQAAHKIREICRSAVDSAEKVAGFAGRIGELDLSEVVARIVGDVDASTHQVRVAGAAGGGTGNIGCASGRPSGRRAAEGEEDYANR